MPEQLPHDSSQGADAELSIPSISVEAIYGKLPKLSIRGEGSEPQLISYGSDKTLDRVISSLATVYLTRGPGIHQIEPESDPDSREVNYLNRTANLPDELFTMHRWHGTPLKRYMVLGNMVLAGHRATPEETAEFKKEVARTEAFEYAERLHALEVREKNARRLGIQGPPWRPLSTYSHAVVTQGGAKGEKLNFLLSIENPETLVAAYVLRHLGGAMFQSQVLLSSRRPVNQSTQNQLSEIQRAVWQEMLGSERLQLDYVTTANVAERRGPKEFDNLVLNILEGMTGKIKVTRQPHKHFFEVYEFGVKFVVGDPDDLVVDQVILSSQMSAAAQYDKMAMKYVSSDELSFANDMVELATGRSAEFDQPQLIRMANFLLSPEGKRALKVALKAEAYNGLSEDYVTERLYDLFEEVFGEGYESILKDRTIAGGHPTGDRRVMLTGGLIKSGKEAMLSRPDPRQRKGRASKEWTIVRLNRGNRE